MRWVGISMTRRVVGLLVCLALAALGLTAVTGSASAAAAPIPTCTASIQNCTPPALLNDGLLSAPSQTNFYFATSAQLASLRVFEDQAVSNVLADHGLPASDRAAVQSWGRADALAELWGLIVQAIRTDPGQRSADQQNVVDWLTAVKHRRAQAAADNAGWEYLKWAGAMPGSGALPDESAIVTALNHFANDGYNPVNYNNGTPGNSTSGFCLYTPPAPFQSEYTGNISTPALQNSAGTWCYPPAYQCTSLLGCNNNQPSYDQFVKYGEADVEGDRNQNTALALLSAQVASGLEMAGAGVGAGLTGLALAGTLGPALTSSSLQVALFPYLGRALVKVAGALSEQLTAALAGEVTASAVGSVVTAVITVVVIAVTQGIQIAQNLAVPGQLVSLITNAAATTPDLSAMLNDPNQLGGLFAVFIQAALPNPAPKACDNSASGVVVLNLNGTAPVPCLNAPAIPAPANTDPQFLITPKDSTTATRANSFSWTDAEQDATTSGGLGFDFNPISYTQDTARITGNWFVVGATTSDGTTTPDWQSLAIHYVDWNLREHTAWLHPNGDGSYSFLDAAEHWIFLGSNDAAPDPNTCKSDGTCTLTDSIQVMYSSNPTDSNITPNRFTVKVVAPLLPTLTVQQPDTVTEGTPATLSANATGGADGGYTYQWYLQSTNSSAIVCPIGSAYCGYNGPYSGASIDYTFQAAGTVKGILLATDSTGRTFEKDFTVPVGGVPPTLTLSPNDPYYIQFGEPTTVTGVVKHAGTDDAETVNVDWGDGSSDSVTMQPSALVNLNLSFTTPSGGEYDFTGTHIYSHAGEYTISVTVTDEAGGHDSGIEGRDMMTADTATSMTESTTTPQVGQPVTYTITVDSPKATPTGPVYVLEGLNPICGPLTLPSANPYTVTCKAAFSAPGDHTVWGGYFGEGDTASSITGFVTLVAGKATSTSTLAASSSTPVVGQPVTYTATVAADPETPGGTVTFRDGTTPVCSDVALTTTAPYTATCAQVYATPGTHTLTAVYSGDATTTAATSGGTTVTVGKAATSISLTSAPPAPLFGQAFTFTATVGAKQPSTEGPAATGTVTFFVDGHQVGSPVAVSAGDAVSRSIAGLVPGTYSLLARYSGDGSYAASSGSSPITIGCGQTITAGHRVPKTITSSVCVSGGSITGPLSVGRGGALVLDHVTLRGPIRATGGTVAVLGGTVYGPITITGAPAVTICGSTIRGALAVSRSTGPVVIGGLGCAPSTVYGAVLLDRNTAGVELAGSTIRGVTSIVGNTGSGTYPELAVPKVAGNHVYGMLACSDNAPAPTDGGVRNVVRGAALGQCKPLS